MKRVILLLTLAAVLVLCAAALAEDPFTVDYNGNTITISRPDSMKDTTQTVTLRTYSGTAVEGKHYTDRSFDVTFKRGDITKQVTFNTTESAWDNVPLLYRYQTSTGRNYYVEVLDPGGRAVGNAQARLIRDDSDTYTLLSLGDVNTSVSGLLYLKNGAFATSMASGRYADISGPGSSWTEVTDAGYSSQTPYEIDPASYFTRFHAPASYFSEIGDKLYAAVGFGMMEEDNGYQYIQILTSSTSACDGNDGDDGTVNDPSNSVYKACFELSGTGSVVTDEKKMFFPHRDDDQTRANQTPSVWTEFPTNESKLWQQKFKAASYRAADTGALILDPADTLVVRFIAGGIMYNDWYFKDLFARMALADEQAPSLADALVPAGTYRPGGTVHVTLCFSETVNCGTSSTLQTSWGTLHRQSSGGANVVTYSGVISAGAANTLTITALPADITDTAGHALASNEEVMDRINVRLSSHTLSDPYSYTVSYDLDGGTLPSGCPASFTFTITSGAVTLPAPTREHYTFAGWTGFDLSTATQNVTIPTGSWGDRIYKASWTPVPYGITYDLDGGTHENPGTYTVEDTLTLKAPTRPGYEFTGWTGTGITGDPQTVVTIPKGSAGSRTYTAHWSLIHYDITCHLNGGTLSAANPASYNIETDDITLNNPTRAGYAFTGWTGTGITGDPQTTVTIPKGSTGSRTYTANWEYLPYQSWGNGQLEDTPVPADAATLNGSSTVWSGFVLAEGSVVIDSRVTVNGSATLILLDGCSLTVTQGITVNENDRLTICGQNKDVDEQGSLTVTAPPAYNAGIGGSSDSNGRIQHDAGHITILGGRVNVTANDSGAGIGGSERHSGDHIEIRGGDVTVTTTGAGAGIGGGLNGNGTVNISGGNVNATATGAGPGIGGGFSGNGTVNISGGSVTATAAGNGAGIGGGEYGTAAVTITDGNVKATAADFGAGIGSGAYGTAAVTISGGNITASSGTENKPSSSAAIGSAQDGSSTVLISGGVIGAEACSNTAAIGGNQSGVTISGGTVTAESKNWQDAIGGDKSTVTLTWEAGAQGVPLPCSVTANRYGSVTLGKPFFYQGENGLLRVIREEQGGISRRLAGMTVTPYDPSGLPAFGTPTFTLPAGLTAVEESAFEGGTAITVADAGSCESIGAYAFRGCTALTQIRVSRDCFIDLRAFDDCTSLVAVYGPAGGLAEYYALYIGIPFVPLPAED